jgi:hypothetical protein
VPVTWYKCSLERLGEEEEWLAPNASLLQFLVHVNH